MTEATDPNASPQAPPQEPDAPAPQETTVAMGGVATAATAGSLSPQADAAPTAEQPAAAAPEASIQEPTGAAPDEKAPIAATLGADEAAAVAAAGPGPVIDVPLGQVLTDEAREGIATHLNAIEQLALFWGGETGVRLRNHVGFVRQYLQ